MRYGTAVHRNKRLILAVAMEVNASGNGLFTRTICSENQSANV